MLLQWPSMRENQMHLDYANPDPNGPSAAITLRRIPSVVPHESDQYRGPKYTWVVGPEFELVGFDPRGISRSTPRSSFFDNRAEQNTFWSSAVTSMSANFSDDALPRMWVQGMLLGRLAGDRDEGSLRFMNTDYTARDVSNRAGSWARDSRRYGATFAAMFPEKVGRLVIDAVMDAEDYYAGESHYSMVSLGTDVSLGEFSNNLIDTDKVRSALLTLRRRTSRLQWTTCRKRPILVGIVDYSMIRKVIFMSFYRPFEGGECDGAVKMFEKPRFKCSCEEDEFLFENVIDGGVAVQCNDGKRLSQEFDDFQMHYRNLRTRSSWADMWMHARQGCMTWPEFPKTNFRGPFVANTSFPLLLAGNTIDSVTPLWAANKMSKGFAGSVVLTQDSIGHGSPAAPSLCTQKHIRRYFREGVLPRDGTVCSTDEGPFDSSFLGGDEGDVVFDVDLGQEDRILLEAVRRLAKEWVRCPPNLHYIRFSGERIFCC
ncbi:TAP-like protein-domain-containing protein [Roridomyces roridus]|uniref:TAP-like protein-domain-containing protein n=1 Tax=Roridomyces roridus TaxID=1738132 RepID=A0AAD7C9U7_9AGAR|nr:TAP-like protein-domain-containing protein [Roridomyces roridus]